ncbi:vacuolar protein sorting-associated protein 13C isoform X2 [Alosa sapidissima]|uniref:vacuolar protein sorting-associated protein 13C isoform X2 n=1 Tax=Alosa sapidissima TaxID=34773 RepID=UPI001C0A28AE|nr:vacuolar protein sorting-associated protein 13C isoform X2 [Alosa sapidissima]
MVFESLVSDLLNRFIGNYVENLDKSQLKIGIWGGNVVLENLRVKENALSELDVPFRVKAGQIGKLSLKIPWKNLYNEAVVATLEDVYVLVVPGATIKYDAEKEERYLQEAKQKELQRIDDALQTAAQRVSPQEELLLNLESYVCKDSHRENPKEEKKDSFVEKLATQVIKNLQVKVTSIHIRYEDNVSNPQKPLSIGVTLAELSLQTTDENWNMCILDEASKIFYKLGRLECLCTYWNVNSSTMSSGSWEDIVDMLKAGISTKDQGLKEFQYIFKPIFATAKICINPNAEMELKTPRVTLHLEVDKIALEMTKSQYLTMVELLETFDYMAKNAPYRKFRPDVPVHTNARQWWQYGIQSILEVHIRRLKEMWSWPHIRQHRQHLRAYRVIYKSHLIQGKTKGDRDTQIKELEKVLDVFNITMARQQAHMEVLRSGQKVVCKRGSAQKQSGGFFSSLFWRKESGKRKEGDDEKEEDTKLRSLEAILTSEEKEKLYTAIGYSGSSHNQALPKQYVAVIVSVKLMRTSITLREAENVPEILKVQMVDLTTQISQRPGGQAIKMEAGLEHWYVTGLQQNGVVPSIIASMGSNTSSLLNILFEVNPEDQTADQLLYIQSQPVEIIYDAVTINTLVEFFKPTKGVDLEVITSATLMKLEEIKEKTATGLSHIIQTRKVLDLRINLKPSYFLLPFSGFNYAESDLMILDFGSLQLTTVDQESQQLLSCSSLEEVMDQAYEKYSLELRNVQLLFCTGGKNWKASHQTGSSPQHILQPMDFTLQLSKCMVDQDTRMPRFKLLGELPLLHVKVSEQKIKGMFNLLRSIPLPSTTDTLASPKKVLATPLSNTTKILKASTFLDMDSDFEEDTSDASQDEELMKMTKAELTDLQFKFEVKEVLLQLTRDDSNEQCVLACVCQLGAEGKLRTYDMNITSYLHKVSLDHYEIRDSFNQPLHLICSSDAHDNDLLKVVFVKADPDGPHFLNTFENTEQTLKVEFSSLDFLLHTRALLSCIDCLSSALPEEWTTGRDRKERSHHEKDLEKMEIKGSRDADVVAFKVVAVLGSFGIRVCDDQVEIADIKIRGIDASAMVQSKKTEVFVRLKDIAVMDIAPKTLHKRVVSIVGEEVFSFKLCLYPNSTEGEGYLDTSKVDGKVTLRMGCIQIVYLHHFFTSLLIFVDNFQAAKSALTAATSQAAEKAASSMKEFAEKSFRLSMDVKLKAPLIIIPQSSSSHNALLVDLGLITVSNCFSLVPANEGPFPPLLETMEIKLTQLKLVRITLKSMMPSQMSAETELLNPINLELQVKRNLSSTWFSKIPGLEMQGVLNAMNICLGEEDFCLLTKILMDNIGEETSSRFVDVDRPTTATECHQNEEVTCKQTEEPSVSPLSEAGDQQLITDEGLWKNTVNILLNFEIMEVTLRLKKSHEGIESPFLDLNVSQLGINMTTRKYDMCATTYIQAVSLRCPQFLDINGKPLCLVTSTAECGTELLKVQYAKADKNGPNFRTTYKNTEQIINVLFSSLDVKLHSEALLSVMNYFSSVMIHSPTSTVTANIETKQNVGSRAHGKTFEVSESPVDDGVIDLKILMKLGAFNVLLCDLSCRIADVRIQGLQGLLLKQQSEMHMSTSLKDFIMENVDPNTLHTKVVSITGDEVFRFSMSLTPKATEGSGYADVTKMDGCVKLSVGCIQGVYLHKFAMSLLNFSNHFHMAKEALSVATTHAAERAASSVRDLAQKSVRVSLDIRLKAPVIIIPQSSLSHNALLVDLGLITVDNTFSLLPLEEGPLPVVIEHMNVNLTQLKLSRVHLHQNYSTELLEPVNLVLSVQRNLASSWYLSLPAVQIHGDLKPMKVSLSQEDLKMALSILMENTGEVSLGDIQKTVDYKRDRAKEQDCTIKDVCVDQSNKGPETEQLTAETMETLKFSFNINSLGLVLFGSHSQKVSEKIMDQPLGEFTLHQMRAEGRVLSDNSLEISTVLKSCTLHDHRTTGERVTSRMLGRRDEDSSDAMIDVTYRQNISERKVVVVLQNLYLCASMEFLLAVADFFIQAMPQMPPTKVDKANQLQVKQVSDATFAAHNHSVWMQRTYVHAVVVNPEVVFVANQTCAQAPSLVASFQCDCHFKSDGTSFSLSSNIRDLQLLACPFIRKQEDKAVSTVLHPCSVKLEGRMEPNGPLHVLVDIEEVIIKISPVIINTVLTISTAMTLKAPAKQCEVCPSDWSKLLSVMDINSCNYWFLGVDPAQEMTENFIVAKEHVDENFKFQVKVVQLILESGLGHRTVPLLLAESSLTMDAHNWTSQLQLNADMTLEVNYFNEMNAVWEPLIERVDDGQHRWKLSLEMKTNPTRDKSPVPGDDFIIFPDPQTAITISSRDTMNITLSKCSLSVFSNLAKAFSEGAASSFDYFLKEKAPFTIQNALGIPLLIQHSSNLRIVDKPGPGKLHEVAVNQTIDLTYSLVKPLTRACLSPLQRQESCLFLSIVPTGYSEISSIPISKPGRRLYNIRGPHTHEVVSVLLQVDAKQGNKVIIVRSPLQIKNHFSVPFAILKYCPNSGNMVNVGVSQPDKELHVTLESYRYQLFLIPVGNLEGQYLPSSTCITWKENVHMSSEVQSELLCPASSASFLPLVVKTFAIPDDLTFIAGQAEEDWDPAYIIHLYPAVTIRNLLPYSIRYLQEGSAEFYEISEGSTSDVLNTRITGEIMEFMLMKYQGRNWSGRMKIHDSLAEFVSVCLISQTSEELVVDLHVHVSKTNGNLMLSIFSPYWIINKTSRVLQYSAEDICVKHPSDFRDVILFSFKKKNFFSKNKLQLSVSTSSWSDAFSLDTVGSYGCVRCPDKNMDYLVGVCIQMSSFNLSRIVVMTPFYMLANQSCLELEVGEMPSENQSSKKRWHFIGSKECIPLWPELTTNKLCVRVVGSEITSKSFYFNKQDNGTLISIDEYGGLLVDVNILDHSTVISFSDYYEGSAPALLINHTSRVSILFQQSGCKVHHELKSGEVQHFAWDDPSGIRKLRWSFREHQGELDLVKDEYGSFSMDDDCHVHWVSFLDGRQRVLLFTEDVAVVAKARQAEELEQFQQEISVSLQNLGLSLINNRNKREIAYVGITSSGVVWEMKPKNRWKSFNHKNISLLEKAYQNYLSSAKEPCWVKVESNLEVNFGKLPMQMRQPYFCPIRRNSLAGIQVEYKQSKHQRSLRAQLHWLQVDNQLPGAIFPVVFHPVPPPKSLALDSEPKAFIDASVIIRFNEHSQVMQFKYFMALVQEMAVRLDQGFLGALISLFTPSVDSQFSKKQLIVKDLDTLQEQLMETSRTDSSGLSFFEHFHISPIKLHLSLSLGSSGDEAEQQEMVAVQSLNLLLKSFGATLTDVDDLIFKLAFFEVRFQFYRREKLMSAAIRHYSEQFLKQMYVLVLGLDVLGNPFGLIRGLSEGVEAFFYEPFQGAVQGPEEFAEGFAIGVRSLLGHTVGGAAGMVSRITGSVGKGLAAITMDKEYQQKRREERNRPPKDFGESLAKGGKGFLKGVLGGVTGIVTMPVEGAKKEGAAGFFKGIGKGLVGVVARPTGGIVDMASTTFQGIQRVAESSEEVNKLRPARLIQEDGVIRPYNLHEAQGYDFYQRSEIKQVDGEFFREHFDFPGHRKTKIIITNRRVMCVKEIEFVGHFSKDWECLYKLFYKPPSVEGSDLKLYCKEQNKLRISKKDGEEVRVVAMKYAELAEKLRDAIVSAQMAQYQQQMTRQQSHRLHKL